MNLIKPKIVIILIGIYSSVSLCSQREYQQSVSLMGSAFVLTAVHHNADTAHAAIQAAINEISRIEQLISSWDPASQTSEINRNAGIKPVKVDTELYELIRRSQKVAELTEGAFDISFASMDRIWKFDGGQYPMPVREEVEAASEFIDFRNIVLDQITGTVFLKEAGMKIGFGAIGKGYAANRAKGVMQEMGIRSGLVNAGGDLSAWGKQANGEEWAVAIANPNTSETIAAWLNIREGAVVTSGDYERFAYYDGRRYAHIIDPRTGIPVTGIKSVTVVCPDAELADALATAIFVLGEEKGIALVNQLNYIECLIINDRNEFIASENLDLIKEK